MSAVVDSMAVPTGPFRRLRSVLAQADPVEPLSVGNPLQLTETMRSRRCARWCRTRP